MVCNGSLCVYLRFLMYPGQVFQGNYPAPFRMPGESGCSRTAVCVRGWHEDGELPCNLKGVACEEPSSGAVKGRAVMLKQPVIRNIKDKHLKPSSSDHTIIFFLSIALAKFA